MANSIQAAASSTGTVAGAGAIDHRPLDRLTPYAANARTHSEAQVALVAGSIREYGFNSPVLVDGANGIIAGHGRVLAARKLGLATVPVVELAHLTEAQKRAYILADNKLAEQAGWDRELLALELSELSELGVDLACLGFDGAELDALLNHGATDPREEETPELPEQPVSRPGDLWVLGTHRLLCGDATDAPAVERLLDGVRPHLVVTDPPYGVSYDPDWRNRAGASETRRTGRVLNDDRADWREAWMLFPGDVAYVWHGALHATTVAESLEACGRQRSQLRRYRAGPGRREGRGGRRMSQSRRLSFIEALTNVTVGLLVALATQVILFRLLGLEATTEQTLIITAAFTAVSVLRSYMVRRLFERLRPRREMPS